jgi:hypothetical protein
MQGDAEDADAPGGVLDHGQDISLGAIEQVGREEVAGQTRSQWAGSYALRERFAVTAPRVERLGGVLIRAGQDAVSAGSGWRFSARCCRAWLSSGWVPGRETWVPGNGALVSSE